MKIRWGFFLIATALGIGSSAFAQELKVVDVRRNIPLADDEPVYKDFYINGGESDGLKKNLVVTVVRKISVHDAGGSQSFGDILAPVGQLRIISVSGKVAVAREYKLLSRDELPMLEQNGIMAGDHIDLSGSFVDNKPMTTKKRPTAESHKTSATITAVVTMPPGTLPATAAAPKGAETPAPKPVDPVKAEAANPAPTAPRGVVPASAPAPGQNLEKTADSGSENVH